ncbi:MAG: PilZ domain-containing protein [Candidatus Omnitrophota bacterium]
MAWDRVNKRRFVRVEFPYTIHIITEKGKEISCYTEDISCGGAMVVIKERLEILSIIQLEVYIGQKTLACKGKVIWITETKNEFLPRINFFHVGIEFFDIKEEDRLVIDQCVKELSAKKLKDAKPS